MIAPHSEAAASTFANPGETLRVAREDKNWSLSSVAQQLNLSERLLNQIEAGDFSQLPGHTFARGYVRAYAKLLGLDQNRLVQQFDHHTGTDATGSSVNSLGHIDEPVRLSRNMVRFFGFIFALIAAAAAFFWWQDQSTRNQSGRSVTALERIEVEAADGTTEIHLLDRTEELAGSTVDEPTDPASQAAAEDVQVATSEPSLTPELPAIQDSRGTAAEQGEAKTPAEMSEAPATDAAQRSETVSVPPGEGRLTLEFTADCWARVTDADGKVLYSALAKAGTSRTLVGKTPMDLHVGFAPGVQVKFNGEAVSLSGKTRGETARLKLGQ